MCSAVSNRCEEAAAISHASIAVRGIENCRRGSALCAPLVRCYSAPVLPAGLRYC